MPGLGHVAISRHALAKAESLGITQAVLESTLREGSDTPDGFDIVLRELNNIRLVVLLKPEPFKGARLVKTLYNVRPQGKAKS